MSDEGWRILSLRWAIMFTILAIGNEIARASFSPEVWVDYKILATLTTAAFSLYQFKLSKKYRLDKSTEWGMVIIE
jgi:intracellular septation protein